VRDFIKGILMIYVGGTLLGLGILLVTLHCQPAKADPPAPPVEDPILKIVEGHPGCMLVTTTNHFTMVPGRLVRLEVDLSECGFLGLDGSGMLLMAYFTKPNSSRPLLKRDRVDLRILDADTLAIIGYPSGGKEERVWADLYAPGKVVISAMNVNPGKTVKVRLVTHMYGVEE
jgi:hypothetical protein